MNTMYISTKNVYPEKVGGQNTGRPLHFKKQAGMSPCPPTDLCPCLWTPQHHRHNVSFLTNMQYYAKYYTKVFEIQVYIL